MILPRELYAKYEVMPHIQLHMKRVSLVARKVLREWQGPVVDANEVIYAAQIHDIGNISKIDFRRSFQKNIIGPEWVNKRRWVSVRRRCVRKYGVRETTANMLLEAGVSSDVVDLIKVARIQNINYLLSSRARWEEKILLYADMRVSPSGVVSVDERLSEQERRTGISLDIYRASARLLEKKVVARCGGRKVG